MDNIVGVSIIGVIGALGGVLLGNWLQGRNITRQREWMLQDQKREWVRGRRVELFEKVQNYVDSVLEYVFKAQLTTTLSSGERKEALHRVVEQFTPSLSTAYIVGKEDQELANLVSEFSKTFVGVRDTAKKRSDLEDVMGRLTVLAGQIRQRIEEILVEIGYA